MCECSLVQLLKNVWYQSFVHMTRRGYAFMCLCVCMCVFACVFACVCVSERNNVKVRETQKERTKYSRILTFTILCAILFTINHLLFFFSSKYSRSFIKVMDYLPTCTSIFPEIKGFFKHLISQDKRDCQKFYKISQ